MQSCLVGMFRRGESRRRGGYTLIELMMIVMIIAVSVVAFAPGFGRAMADRQVSIVARELIRIGRRARADTAGYLRAHLIWITPTTGRVQLLRAPTNSCLLTVWKTSQDDCALSPRGPRCLEDLSIATWSDRSIMLYEETTGGTYVQPSRALCYGPSGVMYHAEASAITGVAAALTDRNTVEGGFVYTLHAGTSTPVGVRVHRVLFPLGGSPRALR